MCSSLLPLLTLALVITQHVECFFLIEKAEPKGPIVQLFEWRFDDIAEECEKFLGPNGYSGVQVSPVTESVSLDGDSWHERYQPISYKIGSRSGNHVQFRDMISRCNEAQIKVYVEVVINHMTKKYDSKVYGTDDNLAYPAMYNYPDVPYIQEDFRPMCEITDYNNVTQVRICALDGLLDLDQSKHGVRCKISQFLNELLEMGVAGFSFSHAKYMWPEDLKAIIDRLEYISPFQGFGFFENPFIYQEFVEGGAVKASEYYDLGLVTDFKYSYELSQFFSGKKDLKELKNLVPHERALVFVDNHVTQRGQGFGGTKSLTYREARRYTLANLFLLAWPHGQPRIMSGYEFQNVEQGPPKDEFGKIARVRPEGDGKCANGWTCEHRWLLINQMVKFRKYVKNMPVENWWDNGKNQIAFSRGSKGFVAFNLDSTDMDNVPIKIGLPAGSYCDIFSGFRTTGGRCTGKRIIVAPDGTSKITLKASDEYGVIAVFLQDWLPYVPASLTQQSTSESHQGSESVNSPVSSTGTQEIQNSASTDKEKISRDTKQVDTLTEKQGESTTKKRDEAKEQTSTAKRSLQYEQDTTFAKRGVPTTDSSEEDAESEENPKQDVKEKKTGHEGSKDNNAGGKQDETNSNKQEVKNTDKETASVTDKPKVTGTDEQGPSHKNEQNPHEGSKDNNAGGKQDETNSDKQEVKNTDKETASVTDKPKVTSTDEQGPSHKNEQNPHEGSKDNNAGGKQDETNSDKQEVKNTDKETASVTDKPKVTGTDEQGASHKNEQNPPNTVKQETLSTATQQNLNADTKQLSNTNNKETSKSDNQQAPSSGTQQVQNSEKEKTKTTADTQNIRKSDKQPASDQGSPNVGEQKVPEKKEFPILGRPWIPHVDITDDPTANSEEVAVNGDKSWKQYYKTVTNRKYIKYARVANLMDNNQKKILHSFQRRGFVLINRGKDDMIDVPLQTELPVGLYCDVITGTAAENVNCTGKEVLIDPYSVGRFTLEKTNVDDIIILRPENTKNFRLKHAFRERISPQKWNEVYKTVKFSVYDQTERFYKDIPDDQYALWKGKKGFMLFKMFTDTLVDVAFQTGLPSGVYCDMVSGILTAEGECTGKKIIVEPYGVAKFTLNTDDYLVVIHEGSMIEKVLQ